MAVINAFITMHAVLTETRAEMVRRWRNLAASASGANSNGKGILCRLLEWKSKDFGMLRSSIGFGADCSVEISISGFCL